MLNHIFVFLYSKLAYIKRHKICFIPFLVAEWRSWVLKSAFRDKSDLNVHEGLLMVGSKSASIWWAICNYLLFKDTRV